jgi:hypothetical protein
MEEERYRWKGDGVVNDCVATPYVSYDRHDHLPIPIPIPIYLRLISNTS